MRKKRLEFVEKIQKRKEKEEENKMEEEEDKPKEREKFYREKCHKIKCKCETKCTYTIHDHIHDVAKIYRKEYPRMTLNGVLERTHVNIWKGQGGRSHIEDGSYGYWGNMVAEYYQKMQRGEYRLRKRQKKKNVKEKEGENKCAGIQLGDPNRFLVPGCPNNNKWNPYHECNSWCQERYGDGKKELDPEYPEKSTRVSCDSNLVDGTILWGDARRWKTIGDHEVK